MKNWRDDEAFNEITREIRCTKIKTKGGRRKPIHYYNIEGAFDTECTSLYINNIEKVAYCYIWMLGIGHTVIYGRTLDEFVECCHKLSRKLFLCESKRLVLYVHNLSYDFQFIRKYFNWTEIFATDIRDVLYGVTDEGIEFRCSYRLTNVGLKDLAKEIRDVKINKKVGDLVYHLARNSLTPLTDKEMIYCEHDIKVLLQIIREKLKYEDDIVSIPLTKTGYVRRYCRDKCLQNYLYPEIMKKLTLTVEVYDMLKQAFQGGFTHANPLNSNKTFEEEITSFDFISSYPAVMVVEMFPMGAPKKRKIKRKQDFNRYLKTYCCLIDVTFYEIESKFMYDNYISRSKCIDIEKDKSNKFDVNNGRIVCADTIRLIITEIDWEIITKCYTFKTCSINNFITFDKKYLPKDFVLCVLSLYNDKTKLKDVEGMENQYQVSKGMCNSTYGMSVTDIVHDVIEYENGWLDKQKGDKKEAIDKYNKDKRRFLYYPWGVWITAYARRNLWEGIFECEEDYIYGDTDSIKIRNSYKHMNFINQYNERQIEKLKKAMNYHNLDYKLYEPEAEYVDEKTNKKVKVKKILGQWDNDGVYTKFKTIGAKRYMYMSKNPDKHGNYFHITISGVDKNKGAEYLLKNYADPFKAFDFDLKIPPEGTGKLTHTYIDEDKNFDIIDYMGNIQNVSSRSGIHMEGCSYEIKNNEEYLDFLEYLQNDYKEL